MKKTTNFLRIVHDVNGLGDGSACATDVVPQATQLELFPSVSAVNSFVVFLDVEMFDQGSFLSVLARNGVSDIIDMRPRPIFRRPKFKHSELVAHLCEREINYAEFAMSALYMESEWIDSQQFFATFDKGRRSGLTVCLYDDHAKSVGWLDSIRAYLRRSKYFENELHPRSLAGLPQAI